MPSNSFKFVKKPSVSKKKKLGTPEGFLEICELDFGEKKYCNLPIIHDNPLYGRKYYLLNLLNILTFMFLSLKKNSKQAIYYYYICL